MSDERETICFDCLDCGSEWFECTGGSGVTDCGRRRPHNAHTYVRDCPCRPVNRNYQEAQQRQRRRAA